MGAAAQGLLRPAAAPDEERGMTRFVPNFSTQQLLPPWVSLGARNWAFVIKVPPECLASYLDTHFNCAAPDLAPYHYEPFDYPYGVLRVTRHDNFSSSHGGVPGTQTLRKIDVNWSFPVNRWQVSPDNIRYGRKLVWIEPMAFDNNSYTMFSSREIWGSEVEMARIELDEDQAPNHMHIDVATQGLKTFTPKSISHLLGVMHIELDPKAEADLGYLMNKHRGLANFAGLVFASIGLKGQRNLDHCSEVDTLKQFRDVFNMQVAVYRAIIASRADQSNVSDMKYYDGSDVTLDFMWSAGMAEALRNLFFGKNFSPPENGPSGHPGGSHAIDGQPVDWDLPRVQLDVVVAASFTSDIRYDVTGTLHTYGS
jgi:hypothetical protein